MIKMCLIIVLSIVLFGLTTSPSYASSFSDNFDDGNTDGWWLGYSHQGPPIPGNWRVEDKTLVHDMGGDGFVALVKDIQLSDQTVEMELKLKGPGGYGGVTVWYQDILNRISVFINPASEGVVVSERTPVEYTSFTYSGPASTHVWYELKVEANSASGELNIYLDDNYLATHNVVSLIRTGQSGIYTGNAGGYFDNFNLIDMLSNSDLDGDGVLNEDDLCEDTSADTDKWKKRWGRNRWQVMDGEDGFGWYRNKSARKGVKRVKWGHDMAYSYGCSGHQILDWFKEEKGRNMNGQWKRGISTGILKLFHKKRAHDVPETPKLIETVLVDPSDIDGETSNLSLFSGKQYLFEVSGTFSNKNDSEHADAEYVTEDNWLTKADGLWGWPVTDYWNLLDLMVDNDFVDWVEKTPSAPNTYTLNYAGTGSPVNFMVFDGTPETKVINPGWYTDNIGELTVKIFEL